MIALEELSATELAKLIEDDADKVYRANPNLLNVDARREAQARHRQLARSSAAASASDVVDTEST